MRKELAVLLLSTAVATSLSACANKDTVVETEVSQSITETTASTGKKSESLTDVNRSALLDKTTVLNSCSIILGDTNISTVKQMLGNDLPSAKKNYYFWGTPYQVTDETDEVMKSHIKNFPADDSKDYIHLVTLDDGTIINVIVNYGKETDTTYELTNIPKTMTGTQLEDKFDTELSPYGGKYLMDSEEVEIFITPYIHDEYSKDNTMRQIQKKLNAVGIARLKGEQ